VTIPPGAHVVDRTTITAPLRTDGAGALPPVAGEAYALGAAAGESPVWLAGPGIVASVDVGGGTVHFLHPDDATDEVVKLPHAASACASLTDDTLLLAVGRRFDVMDLSTGVVSAADFPGEPPLDADLNDCIVDRRGRIWVGARPSRDAGDDGVLLVWERGAAPAVIVDGLRGPNGLALNAAGDRLYLADSRLRTIFVHAIDQELGTLGPGSVFADWSVAEGRPDGMAIDADDHLWVAAWDGREVRRYAPDGRLDRAVAIPAARPSSCAFGGPRLDRLLVTSARPEIDDPDDQGGSLFALEVGVAGLAVEPWLR
jgi:sugar lactone lactonase YvrE